MRKICLLLCIAISLAIPCMAEETAADGKNYLFKTSFEGMEEDMTVNTFLSSLGITASVTAGKTNAMAVEADGDREDVLHVTTDISSTAITQASIGISKSYTPNNDILVMEYDLKVIESLASYTFPQITNVCQGWMYQAKEGLDKQKFAVLDRSITSGQNSFGEVLTIRDSAKWHHFKYVYDIRNKRYSIYFDDMVKENLAMADTAEGMSEVKFTIFSGEYMIDNLELYTLDKAKIVSGTVTDGDANVAPERDMEFTFTAAIDESTLGNITLTDMNQPEDFEAVLTSEKSVKIKLNKNMEFTKEYTLDFRGAKAKNGIPCEDVLEFTTEAAPETYIASAQTKADGSLTAVEAEIVNNSAEAKEVTVFVAGYDEYNYLTKMNYVKISLPAESSKKIGVSEKFADGTEKVMLYLWNNAKLMQPYSMSVNLALSQED